MPHVARAWRRRYEDDPDRVCLDFDVSNAYTLRAQRAFLERMQVDFSGLSGWLRWIYRLTDATMVLWRGRQLEIKTGGHQGCPLMSLCHAVVQRCITDSLGLAPVWPGTRALLPSLDPSPPFWTLWPCLPPDGLFGGQQGDISRVAESLQNHMRLRGLRFGTRQAIPRTRARTASTSPHFAWPGCTCEPEGNFE